ncbi:hypothetical protein e1116g03.tmp0061 [Eimeria tenella]|uniref:Uncharacterized protein n=1 Tax=Eimeria tenella TaxID=5802 RepID=C8TE38_EIMTE|nr:hypothetical protein e1116g03.tmp0061 [Eimeria tenella]
MQVQPGTSPSCTKSVHFSRKMYYHSTQTYRSSKSAVSLTHCPLQVVSQPKRLEKLAKEFQHSARRLTACWMLLVAGPNFKFHNESFRICEKALRSLAVQPSIAISPSAPGSSYLLPSHDIEDSPRDKRERFVRSAWPVETTHTIHKKNLPAMGNDPAHNKISTTRNKVFWTKNGDTSIVNQVHDFLRNIRSGATMLSKNGQTEVYRFHGRHDAQNERVLHMNELLMLQLFRDVTFVDVGKSSRCLAIFVGYTELRREQRGLWSTPFTNFIYSRVA